MPYRFVRATPDPERLGELRDRLDAGEIEEYEPFGRAMTRGLENARFDPERGDALWIEEDYCSPPLAMERSAVLDEYFETVTVVEADVDEATGWEHIDDLPGLWEEALEA